MSVEIAWDALDASMAATLEAFLNERFARLTPRPEYLGRVTFSGLTFGAIAPTVDVIKVDDPLPSFYVRGRIETACAQCRD